MALNNRWREIREKTGISLTDASLALGIGKSMLSQIETRNTNTTSQILEKACELYCCQPNDLYPVSEEANKVAA